MKSLIRILSEKEMPHKFGTTALRDGSGFTIVLDLDSWDLWIRVEALFLMERNWSVDIQHAITVAISPRDWR
jgi:hypothetical protein